MYGRQRSAEVAERRRARREREDRSPRLRDEVPRLSSLYFEITASRGKVRLPETRHVRRFVADQSPALFELRCTDTGCGEGGHDLTREVLRALHAASERFEVEDPCRAGCGRTLHIVGVATYR